MKYRPEIDGLRAIAVFPVIFFHAGFNFFSGGYIGVDIFFVISGYLITSIILEGLKSDQFSLINFYERRARRILPALMTVMIVSLPLAWFCLTPDDMVKFSQSLIYVSTYVSNFLFMKTNNYFETSSELNPLLHTWSLSVEEQYYFIFPLFMIYIWKNKFKNIKFIYLIIAFASLLSAIVLSILKPSISFYMLPTRAWEILTGALIAKYLSELEPERACYGYSNRNLLSAFGLVLILACVFMFGDDTPTPSQYTLIPVLGASLVILYCDRDGYLGKVLSSKAVVFFGLLSYSLYLWHQPVFAFSRLIMAAETTKQLMPVLILLTVGLSFLTWKFIEGPFRQRNTISNGYFVASIVLVSLSIMIIGGVGIYSKGFSGRFLNLNSLLVDNTYPLQKVGQCFLLNKETDTFLMQQCDPRRSNKKILLVGDSHAASLYPGLSEYLGRHQIDTVMMTAAFCLPLVEHFPANKSKAATKRCETINRQVINSIENDRYDLIVVSSYIHQWGFTPDWSWTYPEYYPDFLNKLKLLAERNNILVVGQFMVWPAGLNQLIYKEAIARQVKDVSDIEQYSASGLERKIFDTDRTLGQDVKGTNLGYISILDGMCRDMTCARTIDDGRDVKLVTFDYGHLGLAASRYIASTIIGPDILRRVK